MNNKKMILGLGLGAATVMSLSNIDKIDAASLTTTANLNMRSGPSVANSKVGYIPKGKSIQYISASNGWYKVKYNNTTGWVLGSYVKWGGTTINNNNNGSVKNTKTVTIKENLNMRSGPSTSYNKVCLIPKGTTVTSTEQSNGWYKVKYKGLTGWVIGQYVTIGYSNNNNNNTSIYSVKYTTANLNMRRGASTRYSKICSIPQGTQVTCISSSNGWYKVKYKGLTGWVLGQYLSTTKTSTNTKTVVTKIVISKSQTTLKAYDNKGNLVLSTRCAVGKKSTPTPTGTFKIVKKIYHRPYYKGGIAGGDPRNPLGPCWMGLNLGKGSGYGQTYGIHGNNNRYSIGSAVSGGCVRLDNSVVTQLYNMCVIGTTVIIYN